MCPAKLTVPSHAFCLCLALLLNSISDVHICATSRARPALKILFSFFNYFLPFPLSLPSLTFV